MHEKENFVFDGGFSMIKKNDLFEAEITAMTAEGSGICRADGMAVFVPGTAVGDRCVVPIAPHRIAPLQARAAAAFIATSRMKRS